MSGGSNRLGISASALGWRLLAAPHAANPPDHASSDIRRGGAPDDAPTAPASQAAATVPAAAARPHMEQPRLRGRLAKDQNGASREGRRWISASLGSARWASPWPAGWSRRATA